MERCRIVDRAIGLAHKKGLDASRVICEFEPICDGSFCAKLQNLEYDSPVPGFISKLEAHQTKIKTNDGETKTNI